MATMEQKCRSDATSNELATFWSMASAYTSNRMPSNGTNFGSLLRLVRAQYLARNSRSMSLYGMVQYQAPQIGIICCTTNKESKAWPALGTKKVNDR